jgi:hypothetical protein
MRQPNSPEPCDEQFAGGYLKPHQDASYDLSMNVTRGCGGDASPLGDGSSCTYKNWYSCIKFGLTSRLDFKVEGKVVAPGRFEGTATLDYDGEGSCKETYTVRGTPQDGSIAPPTQPTSQSDPGCEEVKVGSTPFQGCCLDGSQCGFWGNTRQNGTNRCLSLAELKAEVPNLESDQVVNILENLILESAASKRCTLR